MMVEVASLRCRLVNEVGFEDEFGEAKLTEDALVLQGGTLPDSVGIPWEELAHLLQHPFVQQRLDEVQMLKEMRVMG